MRSANISQVYPRNQRQLAKLQLPQSARVTPFLVQTITPTGSEDRRASYGETDDRLIQRLSLSDNLESFIIVYKASDNRTEQLSVSLDRHIDRPNFGAILQAAVPFQKQSSKQLCACMFQLILDLEGHYYIQLDVSWKDSTSFVEIPGDASYSELLSLITPELHSTSSSAWSPRDFYDSVYVPSKVDKTHEELDVSELQSTLFAYQKRTVGWMLSREGVDVHGRSLPVSLDDGKLQGWIPFRSAGDQPVYINQWLGLVSSHEALINSPYTRVSGGILAEEMGLGKTVEILAILMCHKRDMTAPKHDAIGGMLPTAATIIIAPESIVGQWASEINLHAPALQVLVYPGIKKGGKKTEKELLAQIQGSDIVLCSYNTLAREVHFAREPPVRNMRYKREGEHERLRSPLVQVNWWRCVLDECQMIQSGVSNAAEVALQLPRQHAWAVSGTPLRKDPGDVYGLLRFLQLLPFSWSTKTWTRLLDHHQGIFKGLINQIAIRHTKYLVKDEIELPPQKRIISTISLTQIEDQHYSNMFDRMCARLGLDRQGGPLHEDWDPEDPVTIEQMRMWLTQLRQLCLHPYIGIRNRRALGGRLDDVLRTVEDVLQVMTEQNEVKLRADERSFLTARLRKGQLLESERKTQEALGTWKSALISTQALVKDARLAVEKTMMEIDEKKEDWSSEKAAKHTRLTQLRARLRLALELEHVAEFFVGNAYFQLKGNHAIVKPDSEEYQRLEQLEVKQYDAAKALRVEMLMEPRETAQKLISVLNSESNWDKNVIRASKQGFPEVQESGGIESGEVLDGLDELTGRYNSLLKQILAWRGQLIDMLSKPLVDQDDKEIEGDEYETSTKEQDEAYVRMDIFRTAVADLSETLTGQENALIKKDVSSWTTLAKEGSGHAPELMLELLELRSTLKPPKSLGSIRGILAVLRSKKNNFYQSDMRESRRKLEAEIMGSVESTFRKHLADHEKLEFMLTRDVAGFINAQNARLEFYRQLQHISDLVAPWPEEEGQDELQQSNASGASFGVQQAIKQKRIEQARAKLDVEERQLQESIKKKTSQARYLEHLKNASSLGDGRRCIICQDDQYEIGVLTACGHLFCKDCINIWLASHGKCPQCRATIKSRSELYQITYKPQEIRMEEEVTSESSSSPDDDKDSPKLTSIYSQISTQHLNEIKSIDLAYNYTTKIDFIARHIIWLRKSDPGSKTVVFSQFRSFCPDRLCLVFGKLGIRFAAVGGRIGIDRFKHDPNIECLLMHAGSQASGMNLVNASHVLLCEPLVNTALELQAIARVHRIGQHRPTTVWMYLTEGTVEKAIYDLSVERRLEHVGKQKRDKQNGIATPKAGVDEDIEAADAEEMNEKPLTTLLSKSHEGEFVGKDDLWACLFGNGQPQRELPELRIGEDDTEIVGE